MRRRVLLDTGPLVAFLNRGDRFHSWAEKMWANIEPPILTCEAVMTEACFLLSSTYGGKEAAIALLHLGIVQIPFDLSEEAQAIEESMRRYSSVPMALADACLVRMAELYPDSSVLTLDSDFVIYRKNRNEAIATIVPTASR
ncbi:PIN domain-containing protein [Pseudanabaena sp. PCC 6802]|uniref:type II toxin-antitoxin system VapC family toxin n=1 Tax=Pseudanabaena sp. PCC 6802 TaxID=118173 RepID=UPI0003650CBE